MRLIYLSPLPWASFAQRPHKFVDWFHRRTGASVDWIEPYPSRFPRLSDLRRAGRAGATLQQNDLPQWLRVLRPRALPIEPVRRVRGLNRVLWGGLLAQLAAPIPACGTAVVIGKPSALALDVLARLSPRWSIYDMMDDFPAFHHGAAARAMARNEAELVGTVDEVWSSSTVLAQAWLAAPNGVRLVPNALDAALLPPRMAPDDKSGGRRKVFGYVGTLGGWFDWAWVEALARCRHLDTVRLIGPLFCDPPARLPANVQILPAVAHLQALMAMRAFDVGLIPFCIQRLTDSVDPIKYYEYKALGLPVLSTDFGEMRLRRSEPGTFISVGREDVGERASAALDYLARDTDVEIFIMKNSWDARFDATQLLEHLN
jgi:hypothetical protein